ncbi:MAG: hypothetical protein ABIT37_25075 [Luteolibacter sp.]
MTHLLKILAVLNGLGALASAALLISTWYAQGHIIHLAKETALAKTRTFVDPAIPKMEELLGQSAIGGRLPQSVREKLETEIMNYRQTPDAWLSRLADGTKDRAQKFDLPAIRNPLARAALDFVTRRMGGARAYFKSSFDNLILDLRIFALTNLTAFLTATMLCFVAKTPFWRFRLSIWSGLLFVSTLISIFLYAGQSWLWNILANHYGGWTYAAFHLAITSFLAFKVMIDSRPSGPSLESQRK